MKPAQIWEVQIKMSSRPTEFTATYILRLQIGQYVEQQTDNISTLVSVSSKLQLTTTSSTLQLSTNQLYSHFSGIPEPRPRQTVPIPCLFFWFSWNARTQTSPDSPYSSQFHVSLESQNPDLARQPLFHAYFPTSHGMPEPRPRQTAPIPISFTFLSFLQKSVLWAYARLQASSCVNLATSCNLVHVLTFHNVSFRLFRNLCKS